MPTTIPTITSSTRPGSPSAGDAYFETDTKSYIIYDGANWRGYESDVTTANTLSLEFDGGDRLDTTYSMTSVQSFTVMFWMKSTDTTNYISPVSDSDSSGNRGNLELLRVLNQTDFYILFKDTSGSLNLKNGVTNFNSLCDGSWHHVAMVFDSSGTYTNVTIYKDGSQAVSEDANTTNSWSTNNKVGGTSAAGFAFGQRRNGALPYTGKMDQMAFFESALTSTNISDIYNSGNGGDLLTLGFSPDAYYRVGYYPLEDTNSDGSAASAGNDIGTVADYSGNNNDASQATASLKPNYVADPAF
jgi:hypothetical protein